jgi:hypothetical protein
MYDDIRLSPASIDNYIESWAYFHFVKEEERQKNFSNHSPQAYAALFDHMYGNLNILEQKTRALISSTSMLTAILSLLNFRFEPKQPTITVGGGAAWSNSRPHKAR